MFTEHLQEMPKEWQRASEIFTAMGEPYRQRILLLFEPGEALSIADIVDVLGLSRTAVVHHLKVLEHAGILCRKKQGKKINYTLDHGPVLKALGDLRDYINSVF